MPIPVYQNFSDADLGAIFAYLRTVPALKNRVPEPRSPVANAPAEDGAAKKSALDQKTSAEAG